MYLSLTIKEQSFRPAATASDPAGSSRSYEQLRLTPAGDEHEATKTFIVSTHLAGKLQKPQLTKTTVHEEKGPTTIYLLTEKDQTFMCWLA